VCVTNINKYILLILGLTFHLLLPTGEVINATKSNQGLPHIHSACTDTLHVQHVCSHTHAHTREHTSALMHYNQVNLVTCP